MRFTLVWFFILIISIKVYGVDSAVENIQELPAQLELVQKELQKSGLIKADCNLCSVNYEADKKIELNKPEIDIGTPYYIKNNNEYVLLLKRTHETPSKVSLFFKNGHTVCGRAFVGASGFGNGNIFVECLIKYTEYEDEEIELNFKKFPALKVGEEQYIRITINKPKQEVSFYDINATVVDSSDSKINKSKMFFGSGHEFKFSK
jgi:hypothetical protein